MKHNLKTKPTEYVHFRGIKCGCEGCREPAFAQFFICSLDAWMAVCRQHDLEINHSALRVIMSKEKADLCLKIYHTKNHLDKLTQTSRGASKLLNETENDKLPLPMFV